MLAYQQMAYVYDQLMTDAPYEQWLQFTKEVFKRSGRQITRVADLGCGTGEITALLAEKNYQMTGIDFSADMLTYAEQKASTRSLAIQWLQQDIRELQGPTNLDAVISYCDVMNYITTEKELTAVFQRVAASLKQGGLFLFDVHSLYHVHHHCINQTFADVMDDISYIWFCIEGDYPGEMYHDLTFFTQNGRFYTRFDEYHHQRTFAVNVYKRLLSEAGFENLHVYADFSLKEQHHADKAERIFFAAEKRSGK